MIPTRKPIVSQWSDVTSSLPWVELVQDKLLTVVLQLGARDLVLAIPGNQSSF
jgi:hypothetical protein